jgi:hypothetical protein
MTPPETPESGADRYTQAKLKEWTFFWLISASVLKRRPE